MDDIDYYNRVHEMLHICTNLNNKLNDYVEGFGYRWDSTQNWNPAAATDLVAGLPGIPGGTVAGTTASPSANVCFKLMCDIFNSAKFIPLQGCPITLELETVSNAADAVVEPIAVESFRTPIPLPIGQYKIHV